MMEAEVGVMLPQGKERKDQGIPLEGGRKQGSGKSLLGALGRA